MTQTRAPRPKVASFLGSILAVAVLGGSPAACQSGGVGDPCVPEDEYSPAFAGFDPAEENIESRSFQCETRICLVNHFQGRVTCPLGQAPPRPCSSPDDASCPDGQKCVLSAALGSPCDPAVEGSCPGGAACDPVDKQCSRYVCHAPGACQSAEAAEADNRGKACCVPGTDTPVGSPVCGQCATTSNRNAERAVYCSCRCGPPDGAPADDGFNYCECPSGFECAEIRKDYDLGDKQLAGKYCIKQGTAFEGKHECGAVKDYFDVDQCVGVAGGPG